MVAEKKIIDEKFEEIERRLKNSFLAIKEDISSIKSNTATTAKDTHLRKEFDIFRDEISKNLSDIASQVRGIASKKTTGDSGNSAQIIEEIAKLRDEIATKQDLSRVKSEFNAKLSSVKNDILSSPELQELNSLKSEFIKKKNIVDIEDSLNEKIAGIESNVNFSIDNLRKEFKKSDLKDTLSFELTEKLKEGYADFTEGLKSIEENVKESFRMQKSHEDKNKEELKEEVRRTVSAVKREVLKSNSIVIEKLHEKENEIIGLQKQINFLKARINQSVSQSKVVKSETKMPEVKYTKLTEDKPKVPGQAGKIFKNILKTLIIVIPIIIILYAFTTTFLVNRPNNYFYDIGGEEDEARPYLYPANGLSDVIYPETPEEGVITDGLLGTKEGTLAVADYRDIKAERVYFDVPSSSGANLLTISLQFRNNFPRGGKMSVGIKNKVGWNYTYFEVFDQPVFAPPSDNAWTVATATFDLASLDLKGSSIAGVIEIPHLKDPFLSDMVIGIDYLNISMQKKAE